jgi:CO/xanthine dehydrogenase Mo-binding subunit
MEERRVETVRDVPPTLAIDLVEEPDPRSPSGAKGVGEPPTVVATAAVLSALRDATGLELPRAPARLEDLAGLR